MDLSVLSAPFADVPPESAKGPSEPPASSSSGQADPDSGVNNTHVAEPEPPVEKPTVYFNEHLSGNVMKTLKAQRESGRMCDVVLTVQDSQYWAHKCVLSANSPYLDVVLTSAQQQNLALKQFGDSQQFPQIVLPCDTRNTGEVVLDYMYTGLLAVTMENAKEILCVAETLKMPDIKQCCVLHLAKAIQSDNWFSILTLARQFDLNDVIDNVTDFVAKHMTSIIQDVTSVMLFTTAEMNQILDKVAQLKDEEATQCVFQLVWKWVQFNTVERLSFYENIMPKIRVSHLRSEDIFNLIEQDSASSGQIHQHLVTKLLYEKIRTIEVCKIKTPIVIKPTKVQETVEEADTENLDNMSWNGDSQDMGDDESKNVAITKTEKDVEKADPDLDGGVSDTTVEYEPEIKPKKSRKGNRKQKSPRQLLRKAEKGDGPAKKKKKKKDPENLKINLKKVNKRMRRATRSTEDIKQEKIDSDEDDVPNYEVKDEEDEDYVPPEGGGEEEEEEATEEEMIKKIFEPVLEKPVRKRGRPKLPPRNYVCGKCGKCYTTATTFHSHIKGHAREAPLLCELCGFSTLYISSMNVHKRKHEGRTFKCTEEGCNYSAVCRNRLEDHLNRHKGIKTHMCAWCGKAFSARKHMNRHENSVHRNSKVIPCNLCDYKTNRSDKLRDHTRVHHPEIAVECGFLTMEQFEKRKEPVKRVKKPKPPKAPKFTFKSEGLVGPTDGNGIPINGGEGIAVPPPPCGDVALVTVVNNEEIRQQLLAPRKTEGENMMFVPATSHPQEQSLALAYANATATIANNVAHNPLQVATSLGNFTGLSHELLPMPFIALASDAQAHLNTENHQQQQPQQQQQQQQQPQQQPQQHQQQPQQAHTVSYHFQAI